MSKYEDRISAWGLAPTPLVPKEFVRVIGNIEVPELSTEFGFQFHLSILHQEIWQFTNSVGPNVLSQIVAIIKKHQNHLMHVALPSHPSIAEWLVKLPLPQRTSKIFRDHQDLFSTNIIRFSSILDIPGCGLRSGLEVACLLEQASNVQLEEIFNTVNPIIDTPDDTPTYEIAFAEIEHVIRCLAAWGFGKNRFATLARVLPPASAAWPLELKQLWGTLRKLDTTLVAGSELEQYTPPGMLSKFIDDMDYRWLETLKARSITANERETLESVGTRLNLSIERVRQIETMALQSTQKFVRDVNSPFGQIAVQLRNRLGTAVPLNGTTLQDTFNSLLKDFSRLEDSKFQFAKDLLLWIAGPYKKRKNWLVIEERLFSKLAKELEGAQRNNGLITNRAISNILIRNRIRLQHKKQVLDRIGEFLAVENGFLRFRGSYMDKAHSIMRYTPRVYTVDEIVELVKGRSLKSIKRRLMTDPRFWKINRKSEFVLANSPGYEQYTNIVDKIDSILNRENGRAHLNEIVQEISTKFGVREQSVIAYVQSPRFEVDSSQFVQFRAQDPHPNEERDLTQEVDCFLTKRGRWAWRVLVDRNLLRGSGRPFPDAFATYLGCEFGKSEFISTDLGPIKISRPTHSLVGALIGSLRVAARAHKTKVGDFLFLIAMDSSLTFQKLTRRSLDKAESDLKRAALMLLCDFVRDDTHALSEIADCFQIPFVSYDKTLPKVRYEIHRRGEKALLEIAPVLSIKHEQPRLPFSME